MYYGKYYILVAFLPEMLYYTGMKSHLPSIYEYNDYRTFLAAYQRARYAEDKSFTKSAICKQLGLPRTRSYFNDVLNGKEVTPTFVDRFIKLLGFTKHEAQFFRVLVQFNQAASADEREFYFEQLISLNKTPMRTVDTASYDYYKEWYHSAIRALLDIIDFSNDYAALGKMLYPQIPAARARESIQLLLKLNLIAMNKEGYLKPTEKSITTGPNTEDELIKQHQLQCIDMAREALVKPGQQPRSIASNTLSISERGLKRLDKLLQKFKSEVRSLTHKDEKPASRVFLLNVQCIQLFPNKK